MIELTERQVSRSFDELIITERQELIMQAAEAQQVDYSKTSKSFNLEYLDVVAGQFYSFRGMRIPQGYMAYSMQRMEFGQEKSELKFHERSARVNIIGHRWQELSVLPRNERQTYLNRMVCRVLGNMIADGYSEAL